MPQQFVEASGHRGAVIIDCSEIFTEKPSYPRACAQMFSSYQHNHTVKYLIGIAQITYQTAGEAVQVTNI